MVLNNYRVKFHHENNVNQYFSLKRAAKMSRRVNEAAPKSYTDCEIFKLVEGSEPVLVGAGKALVHDGDNYCREKGRMISLGRALKNAGFTKTQREELWEAYRTSSSKPRW